MVMIRDETITKQWAAVFEAINMPLESVPVKPWYGKEVKILDLTEDDKDEDLAPVPAPASVSAMLQKDRNIEKVVKKVSMGMPDIKGEAGEAEAGKAAILGAGLQVRSMSLLTLHILLHAKGPRTQRQSLEHQPELSLANRHLDSR
jgi:hypothetical protein